MTGTLVSALVLAPIAGALLALVLPLFGARSDRVSRGLAIGFSAATFAIAAALAVRAARGGVALTHHIRSVGVLGSEYLVEADGLASVLAAVVALVAFAAACALLPPEHADARHYTRRDPSRLAAALLALEATLLGALVARDGVLLVVFWAAAIGPAHVLVSRWGSLRRHVAAMKLTMAWTFGTVLLALVIAWLHTNQHGAAGPPTFDLALLASRARAHAWPDVAYAGAFRPEFVLLLAIGAVATRLPAFPFHAWLGEVHAEAPAPGAMLIGAGAAATAGSVLVRVGFGALPAEALAWAPRLAALGAFQIAWGALLALSARDAKRLVAATSLAQAGAFVLGMSAITTPGADGAAFQLVSHALVVALLAASTGALQDRAGHRHLEGFGGLVARVPELTVVSAIGVVAGFGLPGSSGFVGAFLAALGAFPNHPIAAGVAIASSIVLAGALLRALHRTYFGLYNEKYRHLRDVSGPERLVYWPLALAILALGVFPQPVLAAAGGVLHALVEAVALR